MGLTIAYTELRTYSNFALMQFSKLLMRSWSEARPRQSFERVEQLLINMMQSMEQIQATTHRYLSNLNKLWYKSLSKLFQK